MRNIKSLGFKIIATSIGDNTKENSTNEQLKSKNASYFFQKPWFFWSILIIGFIVFIK
ncbi:MAG: hypothetical protein JJV94_05270 [Sulfurospirillum sp.]|nr:hypothetical protein [Sulfurospirillum sp.]